MTTATETQIAQLRLRAVNETTREIMAHGVALTHEQADDLGEEVLAWMGQRLGLSVRTTDSGVEAEPTYDVYILTWHVSDRVVGGYRWIFQTGLERASMVDRVYGPGWRVGEPHEREPYATALVLPRGSDHPNSTERYVDYAGERNRRAEAATQR